MGHFNRFYQWITQRRKNKDYYISGDAYNNMIILHRTPKQLEDISEKIIKIELSIEVGSIPRVNIKTLLLDTKREFTYDFPIENINLSFNSRLTGDGPK